MERYIFEQNLKRKYKKAQANFYFVRFNICKNCGYDGIIVNKAGLEILKCSNCLVCGHTPPFPNFVSKYTWLVDEILQEETSVFYESGKDH